MVCTQRRKCSGMAWTGEGGQVILDVRMIWLRGVWNAVSQRSVTLKPLPEALSRSKKQRRSWEWSDHTLPRGATFQGRVLRRKSSLVKSRYGVSK